MSKGINSPAPTTAEIVGGVYNAVAPVLQDGQAAAIQLDINGQVKTTGGGGGGTGNVNITGINGPAPAITNPLPVELSDGTNPVGTAGNPLSVNVITGGGSNASVSPTGAAVPASATFIGVNKAGNLVAPLADASGNLQTVVSEPLPAGTNVIGHVINDASSAVIGHVITDTNSVTLATTNADTTIGGTTAPSKELLVAGKTNDGTPQFQPIPEGTGGRSVIIEGVAGGTAVPVSFSPSGTQTVAGALTNNNAAPSNNNVGVLPALANAGSPSYTDGDMVLPSTDMSGSLRVTPGSVPAILQKTNAISSGSVASLAKAFAGNVRAGTTIVVSCGVGVLSPTQTVTDSAGNVYQLAISRSQGGSTAAILYATNTTAGALTVTVNNGGAAASIAMEIYEVAGLLTVEGGVLDTTSAQSTTSAAPGANSGLNPNFPDCLVFSVIAVSSAAQTITITPGLSPVWSNDSGNLNPTTPAGLFSLVAGSTLVTQGQLATFQGTMTSEPWASATASFRPFMLPVSGAVAAQFKLVTTGVLGPLTTVTGNAGGTNALPVSLFSGGSAFTDGVSLTQVSTQGIASLSAVPAFQPTAQIGSTNVLGALRTPAVFKTASVPATASGNTAVWTPAAGKKFRLMRFQVTGVNLAATASTVITISFQDSASGMNIGTYDVLLPAAATATGILVGGVQFNSGWCDLGNGFLSAAANNVLNYNVSATVTGATGSFRVSVAGTEE